jgi:hypothetical protein
LLFWDIHKESYSINLRFLEFVPMGIASAVYDSSYLFQIRNPKHEILNKFKLPKSQIQNHLIFPLVPYDVKRAIAFGKFEFRISGLFSISILDIRI